MYKLLTLLILFSSCTCVYAHDGRDGWVTITNYRLWSNTYNNPTIRIVARDSYYNPSNCKNSDSYMVSTSLTLDVQERIYSTLLASYFAKTSVRLYVSDNDCENERPKVLTVVMD